jgi:hypothetical protein
VLLVLELGPEHGVLSVLGAALAERRRRVVTASTVVATKAEAENILAAATKWYGRRNTLDSWFAGAGLSLTGTYLVRST